MKKVILTIGLGLLFVTVGVLPAFAITPGDIPGPIVAQQGPVTITGWVEVLMTVIRWIYTIVFILAVFFILLAAFFFVTSQGDPEKVTKARNMLMYAVIGIVVALLSFGIVTLVQNSVASQLAS